MPPKQKEKESDWADRLGIKCSYPDGANRCAGCPHYFDPERNPECSYATPHGENDDQV